MKLLECPCGEEIAARDDDELVDKAKAHLKARHPDLADIYEREHILFIARDIPDPPASG